MKKTGCWQLAALAAGLGAFALFAEPVEGTAWNVAAETEDEATANVTVPGMTINGTASIAADTTLTVSGQVVSPVGNGEGVTASLTVKSGATLAVVGGGGGNASSLAIGMLGGDGTIVVEAGATLSMQNSAVINIGRNDNDHRPLPSHGTLDISGTVLASEIECAAWFPTLNGTDYPSYLPENMALAATINLNAGGLLQASRLRRNDQSRIVINANGGTYRITADDSDVFVNNGSPGAMQIDIPAGSSFVFDTNGHNAKICAVPNNHAFFTIQGAGGFVKKGGGYLQLCVGADENTFSGPIVVEAGVLSLGRPLVEGQTVRVMDGAKFYPVAASDFAKITYDNPADAPGTGELYVVQSAITGGLDLLSMAPTYRTDALGGPEWGWGGSVDGTVTHSEATPAAPFQLVGVGGSGGTVTFSNTGLDAVPLKLSGNTEFTFSGDRVFGFTDPGYLQFDAAAPGKYKQTGAFNVRSDGGTALLDYAKGTVTVGGNFGVADGAGTRGKAVLSDGAKLTVAGQIRVGHNGGDGEFYATNATINVTGNFVAGGTDSSRAASHGKVELVNTTLTTAGEFQIAPTAPNGGADRTTLMNEVTFGPGAVLNAQRIRRNDDPHSKVTVKGLTFTPSRCWPAGGSDVLFYNGQFGTWDWELAEGGALNLSMGTNTFAFTCGDTRFAGAGDLRLTATQLTSTNVTFGTLLFGYWSNSTFTGAAQFNWTGETFVERGRVVMQGARLLPSGTTLGGTGSGLLDLNCYDQRVKGFRADSCLDVFSTHGSAKVAVGAAESGAFTHSAPLRQSVVLEKRGSGTMTVAGVLDSGLLVREGAAKTVNTAPCYRYYRFKVENIKNRSAANSMQIAEFKFMDGAVDVTRNATIGYDSNKGGHNNTFPGAETPAKLVDGNVSTKWLDFRAVASAQADRDRVWISFDYGKPQRVTHYAVCTANDDLNRDPTAWRVQGSDDGTSWVDLDVRSGNMLSDYRWQWSGPFPLCGSVLGSVDGALDVVGGASFTADGGTVPVRSVSGAVTLQNGATLLSGGGAISGSIAGDGGLVKNGEEALDVFGAHTYTGLTRVEKGALNLGGGAHAVIPSFNGKYFRWVVRGSRANLDAITGSKAFKSALYQASEFQLVDASGAVQSQGLLQRKPSGLPAEMLGAGQFSVGADYAFNASANEGPEKLFDGSVDTKSHFTTALDNTPKTYYVYTMRLKDNANPIVGYKIFTANDYIGRDPQDWVLQGSYDGLEWITLDERVAVPCNAGRKSALNNGNAFTFNGALPRYRVYHGKYFRFTFKKTTGNDIFQISELMLYDRQRRRVNIGLTKGSDGAAANTLAAGTFSKGAAYSPGSSGEDADKLFDNNPGTKCCLMGALNGGGDTRVFTMRLADDADPVCSYNFLTANDGISRTPCNWLVEGSVDGVNWETLDEQVGVPNPTYLYSPVAADFPLKTSGANSLASLVQVDEGATLNLAAGATIGGLRIDAAGAGTVNGLNPSEGGVLEIVNLPAGTQVGGYVAPLTVNLAEGASATIPWAVKVNGVTYPRFHGKVNADSKIEIAYRITMIFVR